MVLSEYKVENGNSIVWLGKGGIWGNGEKDEINNVLILAGGEVLFLKTVNALELYRKEVRDDIFALSYEEFIGKYDLPSNKELWSKLKEDVKSGKFSR
jgi:hypothetical protein